MIQHDDAIHVGIHRSMSILDHLNALELDEAIPVCAQEREVIPSGICTVGLLQPPEPEPERLPCFLFACREACTERVQVEQERGAFRLGEVVIVVVA